MEKSLQNLSIDQKISYLKNVSVFQDTSEAQLFELASVMTEKIYQKEATVFKKGDAGDAMYIIASGKVRVHDGSHVHTRLENGDVFGEYSLFDQEVRSASVTAEEKSLIFKLGQEDFDTLMENNVDSMKGVLRVLIGQIRNMNVLESKLAKSYLRIHKQKEEIEKQHKDISEQKQQLEESNERLTKLNKEKSHLLKVIAQDLRNPLTSGTCLVDMLYDQKEDFSKDHQDAVKVLKSSINKMNTMINHILDINEIESRNIKVSMEKTNINLILRDVLSNNEQECKQRNVDILLEQKNHFVNVDPNYSYLVFDNLLYNLIKYSPEDKEISINTIDTGDYIRVAIRDQGQGIREEDQKKVFGYYQSMKHNEQGQVIQGHSIIRKYIKAMNGNISMESKKGRGTTVFVELLKYK
jgi:signal transduction histidine kinase